MLISTRAEISADLPHGISHFADGLNGRFLEPIEVICGVFFRCPVLDFREGIYVESALGYVIAVW